MRFHGRLPLGNITMGKGRKGLEHSEKIFEYSEAKKSVTSTW